MSFKIPLHELEFSFVRSSGPGGQNVNKVNSKAVLRWNMMQSASLSDETRARIQEKLATKLTQEGELIVMSDVYRDQGRNRDACIQKLEDMVRQALIRPKARKKTKPSWSSQKRNEASKKRHSEKKKLRKVDY